MINRTDTWDYYLTINPAGTPNDDDDTSAVDISYDFMEGIVGLEYEDFIVAKGGTAPYEWAYEGELPAGITGWTSGANNEYVTLEGTPTTAGSYSFSILLIDANKKYKQKDFSVSVTDLSDLSEEERAQKTTEYTTNSETARNSKGLSSTGGNTSDRSSNVNTNGFSLADLKALIESIPTKVDHEVSLGGGCDSGLGVLGLVLLGAALLTKRSK